MGSAKAERPKARSTETEKIIPRIHMSGCSREEAIAIESDDDLVSEFRASRQRRLSAQRGSAIDSLVIEVGGN